MFFGHIFSEGCGLKLSIFEPVLAKKVEKKIGEDFRWPIWDSSFGDTFTRFSHFGVFGIICSNLKQAHFSLYAISVFWPHFVLRGVFLKLSIFQNFWKKR